MFLKRESMNNVRAYHLRKSASAVGIQVAIEGNQESFIQEIALNGQETWIQPLSMGEKLQLATQKIDFNKVNGA